MNINLKRRFKLPLKLYFIVVHPIILHYQDENIGRNMTANMRKIPLAFGNGVFELDIPERNISSVILPSEPEKKEEATFLIKTALENPIKSRRLSEIVNPDSKSCNYRKRCYQADPNCKDPSTSA